MFRWRMLLMVCLVLPLVTPAHLLAQGKDDFARAVVDAINADQAPPETRRVAMVAAIDAMAAGLRSWDAAVAKVEGGLAAEIPNAPPPVGAKMRMALGAVYLERGRFDLAAGQFAQAAVLVPSSPEPHAFRGLALEHALRGADAAEAYRQAWRRDDGNPVHAYRWLRAARGAASGAEVDQARAVLLRAAESAPPSFELLTVALLEDRLASAPMMPLEGHAEAFMLMRHGRYDEALARLRAALKAGVPDRRTALQSVSPAGPLPLIGAAPLLARMGRDAHVRLDLATAIAAYERRVSIAANESAAHYELADVYRANDEMEAALIEAAAAALLDPAAVKPRLMIGQLHAAAGRDVDAVRTLERVVAMAPDEAEARYALSRAYMRTGRRDAAERELTVFQTLQAKAMAEERQRFEDNFRAIEKALEANPVGGQR